MPRSRPDGMGGELHTDTREEYSKYSVNQKGQRRKRILPKTERHRKDSEKFMASEQAVEKRPSVPRFAGFPSSFPVSSTGQTRCSVREHSRERIYAFPTRDFACLRVAASAEAGAPPQTGFRRAQLASACLRVAPPCGAEAGAFLISLKKMSFSTDF